VPVRGAPTAFWAKLEQDEQGNVLAWHPLAHHCIDVAVTASTLLEVGVLGRRLATLAGLTELSATQRARLAVLAGLHDVGKFNHGFQNKARAAAPFTAGHVAEALALVGQLDYPERGAFAAAIRFESLAFWGPEDAAARLLLAAIGHHGRPGRCGGAVVTQLWQRGEIDPFAGMANLLGDLCECFPAAFSAAPDDPLPNVPAFHHAFAGLVMLADWIASDVEVFPFSTDLDAGTRRRFAERRAHELAERAGIDPRPARRGLGPDRPTFSAVSSHSPRPMQERVASLPVSRPGSLVVVEAETGSGKTEAALSHYLNLFHAGEVDGLYFALPTRTAATQLHARIAAIVARAFPELATRPSVVLAVPGYLRVDEVEGTRLSPFEVLWNDDARERSRHRYWAAEQPKRYLAGAIVVGTVDQVLLSTLMVPHAHLRAAALLRHLLVVDEVHASDAYMTRLLEEVLAHHVGAGGHTLLLSATLGAAARCRLEGAATNTERPCPLLGAATAAAYPLVTAEVRGDVRTELVVEEPGSPKRVTVELAPWMDDASAVAERAVAAAERGARVLVIRNTVTDCVATQLAAEHQAADRGSKHVLLRAGTAPVPHHSRYARKDREALDCALEAAFGRDGVAGHVLAIATQTVQQSLDIDADLLLTDLCPADVLLQRIGRLFRHSDRRRPDGFEAARVVVLVPQERDLGERIARDGTLRGQHGIGSVYEDAAVLEATWLELERRPELDLPAHNRVLVEQSTHPEALDAIAAGRGPAWQRHREHVLGRILGDRRVASLNLVDRRAEFGEFEFPCGETERRITTRLGEGDRLLTFAEPIPGLAGPVHMLTMPAWMARGVPAEAEPTVLERAEHRARFTFGEREYVYDRLGLRLAPEKSEEHGDEEEDGG